MTDQAKIYELRDTEEARAFITQGLWLQRVMEIESATVPRAINWAIELISQGQPLPPIGFLADLGHVALGLDWEGRTKKRQTEIPHLPPTLLSTYEDHVLGKIYGDWSFSHASDYVRGYEEGREQAQGLAFIVRQFRERAHFPGVELSPGVLATLKEISAEDVLSEGFDSLQREGLHPYLEPLYEDLIKAARRTAEVLSREDVEELQLRSALAKEGERMALRQTLTAANWLETTLPRQRIKPLAGRQEVPTRVLDEDTYPVGGFSSISNKGSVESLLHSQLAYIEDDGERPDLFEIKFLRDELLFYSRDENQFLRRRRTFVLAFYPDLTDQILFKDRELPYQRFILLLALVTVVIQKLIEWLNEDALTFDLVFLRPPKNSDGLKAEREILEQRFREQINNGTVQLYEMNNTSELERHCSQRSRRSLVHCLAISANPKKVQAEDTVVTKLQINNPKPLLGDDRTAPAPPSDEDAETCWTKALEQILQRWI